MVRLYHTTHYFQAEEAFTVGRLESEPEKRLRELAEKLGSHSQAEKTIKNAFGKNRYSSVDNWFAANYIICQTEFRPDKGGWINDKLTKDHVVVFEFDLEGYIVARRFDFPNDLRYPPYTVLSKDPCEPSMEQAIRPNYVGVQSADLKNLVSLAVSPGLLAEIKIVLKNSEHEYLKTVPVNIFCQKNGQWRAFPGI